MRTRNIKKEALVIEQAINMLVNEGMEGFGMNRLADACGISVATLYIYYADKNDLIRKIGGEIGERFMAYTLDGFSPEMPFAEGLRKQWENRARFTLKYSKEVACYEVIRNSVHGDQILDESLKEFRTVMNKFCRNAIKKKELLPVSLNAFWSVAYGPLYTLLRFHDAGKSIGGKKYRFSKSNMEETLQLVIKALTP
jgi:AcrR family transcriptional regulator